MVLPPPRRPHSCWEYRAGHWLGAACCRAGRSGSADRRTHRGSGASDALWRRQPGWRLQRRWPGGLCSVVCAAVCLDGCVIDRNLPKAGQSMTTAARRDASVADRQAVFLSGALLGIGWIVFAVVSRFHPGGVDPNNHRTSFTQYAQSSSWIAVHLGVFVGVALIVAGLVVLFYALNVRQRMPGLVARIGIVSAGVALGLAALDG